jgi:pyruvate dehydrogenase E2 component (dihydrolipoamide acetyltransferase)
MTVTKVVLAKLSPTMEEGTIVKWSKKEGDPVKVGDVLAEIETDKANMEMEALGAGVLRKILVPAGGKAPVGNLIGVIANPDEDISAMVASAGGAAAAPAPAPQAPPPPAPQAAAAVAPQAAQPQPAPAQPAARPAAPPPSPTAQAPEGEGGRVKASPLARSMAAQQNIPLSSVPGSGPGGRIIKRDIEAWSAGGQPAAGAPAAAAAAPAPGPVRAPAPAAPSITPGQEIPVSNMRKTIARRLSESMFTSPHFYVTVEIDMDAAVALREQLLKGENVKVSFNDLVIKACAKALTRFPMVNSSWGGDKITTHADVHIGVAVAIPDGLITPVVRNADRKAVTQISREVKDLAGRAKEKKLKPEEFMGSTFTISNLGMFDVTDFTAIINPPESAILAVGAVRKVPVVADDVIRVGHRMNVTLSSDHRVVDGALAAQFLADVRRLLENPVSLFV